MQFHEDLMFPNLAVDSRDALLETLGAAVASLGLAKDGYAIALKERERHYPTGLPICGGVAIPHTSADHVTGNTIAAASLAHPVTFFEMGGDEDSEVEVSTVFLLVFANADQHVPLLSRIVNCIQDSEFIRAITAADNPTAMADVLAEAFPSDPSHNQSDQLSVKESQ